MIKFCQQFIKRHFVQNHNVCRLSSSLNSKAKSSLLISGKRASDTFIVVVPHLDFNEKFDNLSLLEENIKRRKLNLNVPEMKEMWDFYNDWNLKKLKLQESVELISKQITIKIGEEKNADVERLKRQMNLLKEDLQHVKENVWDMEDNVICELLKIPNDLHPEAPEKEEEIYTFDKENIRKEGFDHLVVGEQLECLEYENKLTCFLKNNAALLELALPEYFIYCFSNEDFIRFSNPDFSRSVLAEGVGLPPLNTDEMFLLEQTEGNNDHLYLCGGASLFPFCGFHTKHVLPKQHLPVRYIAPGRRYIPQSSNQLPGLYSANQSTCLQIFSATNSKEEVYYEFKTCLEKACEVYSALGLNFKVVKQTPEYYKCWESLRASIRVYSPYHKDFIEVGNVSLIDDYVSKRLRMCFSDRKDEPFLRVVSATLINTQVLLALCLERSRTELFVPQVVRDFMIV